MFPILIQAGEVIGAVICIAGLVSLASSFLRASIESTTSDLEAIVRHPRTK